MDRAASISYSTSSMDLDRRETVPLEDDEMGEEANPDETLLNHPKIPKYVRYGIPAIILANVGLFLFANLRVGAAVNAYLSYTDDGVENIKSLPALFDFSLENSVVDMWKAEVFALSIIIAAFSGCWPYLKLLMMLLCWITPIRILNQTRRERVLILLDACGKWSLVDAYVLVVMMVAFRFHLGQEGQAAMDVIVESGVGFYGFLMAAIVSLTMSHVILAWHRFVMGTDTSMMTDEMVQKEALWHHSFANGHDSVDSSQGPFRFLTRRERLAPIVLLCGAFLLILSGSVVDSIHFDISGAAGFVIGSDASKSYSLISLGKEIILSTYGSKLGVGWIELNFFLYALLLPLCHIIVSLMLWTVPMTIKTQYRFFVACEVVNS